MANAIMNNLMTFEYEQIVLTQRTQETILESEFINYFRLSVLVRIITLYDSCLALTCREWFGRN